MAIDEMFDAAAYVRDRCKGGDVDELAAFALCCKADATRLGNMVDRIQRKLDAVIETRDAARKAFDEALQQRQDALAELKSARQMADAIAAAHAEASRLRDETIETLQREIAAERDRSKSLNERVGFVENERDMAVGHARNLEAALEAARSRAGRAAEERDRAVRERDKLSNAISLAYGERDSAITARNGARAEAERAERERDLAAKAHVEAAGVVDRLGCRIVDLEAEVLCLQGERDRARAEIEEMRVELNSRMNEANESRRLARDLAEMTVSRDRAREWAESLRQRPTYEARTTPPTPEELAAHRTQHGGWWVLTSVGERPRLLRLGPDDAGGHAPDLVYVALADGLPCAWPVPAGEVLP